MFKMIAQAIFTPSLLEISLFTPYYRSYDDNIIKKRFGIHSSELFLEFVNKLLHITSCLIASNDNSPLYTPEILFKMDRLIALVSNFLRKDFTVKYKMMVFINLLLRYVKLTCFSCEIHDFSVRNSHTI